MKRQEEKNPAFLAKMPAPVTLTAAPREASVGAWLEARTGLS